MTGFVDVVIVVVDDDGPSVSGNPVIVAANYRLKILSSQPETRHARRYIRDLVTVVFARRILSLLK